MKGGATVEGPKHTIVWRKVRVWIVRYRSKKGDEITVKTLRAPERERTFRVPTKPGRRKFYAVAGKSEVKELLVVAKKKAQVLSEEDLAELEELEDSDDEESEASEASEESASASEDEDTSEEGTSDEDEEDGEDTSEEGTSEDEDDDEESSDESEESEDEEPVSKKKDKKTTSKSAKKEKPKASKSKKTDGRIGTAELAKEAGVTPRALRMWLRKQRKAGHDWAEPDSETGRYEFPSLKNKDAQKIIKGAKKGAAEATKESLKNLKDKKSKDKKSSGKKDPKKSKAGKKGGKKKK